jgi:iron complex outermembrane receptor protein
MFKRTKVCSAALLAIGGAMLATSAPVWAQQAQTVEITGSRIKRVDAEGALPITTYTREDLQNSGVTTVAEFIRTIPFAQAGNFRPQSGSSYPGVALADLRGLGAERTLILLDGKRLPKSAAVGSAADVNTIPMAAIERVEVLTDGASAIYGSEAIGGVINFITRKDFNGAEFSVGYTDPVTQGGSKREFSAVLGMSGDKGRIIGGFTNTKRGMVFTRQRPWGSTPTSNLGNYAILLPQYTYHRITGLDGTCEGLGPGFFTGAPSTTFPEGNCVFNASGVNADEQEIENQAVFVRGEYQFAPDWSVFVTSSVSRVDSFGRYAPAPGGLILEADSPGNPFPGETTYLLHRYAAAGNRDDYATSNLYDFGAGIKGRIANKFDVEIGARKTESVLKRLGYNYIVSDLAAAAIDSGAYDVRNPYATDIDVLNGIKATISRDARFDIKEVYANATTSLFSMSGGESALYFGLEHRRETYADLYDSLSEAGQIIGSAGNSAGGSRKVSALSAELLLPVTKALEVNLSARYEKYSDYGSDFSPKASVKFKALPNLALRASVGKGFRAPSLDILTQKDTFSAETVTDPRSCTATGVCDAQGRLQRNTIFTANPSLSSEKSDQYSFGAIWDATPNVSLKADYWSVKINDVIGEVSAQDLVDRDNGDDPRAIPPGLGVIRGPNGAIQQILAGYANEGVLKTSGLDLSIDTRWATASFGKFSHKLTWAHMLEYKIDGDELAGTQALPEDRIVLQNNWTMGAFDASWNVNYIGKNGSGADSTRAYTTHDVQVSWATPIKGAKLTLGMLNATDKRPQLVSYDGRNFNFYLYDSYGRQPYIRYTQSF